MYMVSIVLFARWCTFRLFRKPLNFFLTKYKLRLLFLTFYPATCRISWSLFCFCRLRTTNVCKNGMHLVGRAVVEGHYTCNAGATCIAHRVAVAYKN